LSSVIAALGSLDLRLAGKVGARTFFYYVLSTVCAVILGVVLVATIHPGVHNQDEKLQHPAPLKPRKIVNGDVMMDMLRNMFPANLVQATLYQYETILDVPTPAQMEQKLRNNESINDPEYSITSRNSEGTNILGLVVFSTAFGIALASMGVYGRPILKLFRCLSQLLLIVSSWVLWLSPIGIFCLLAGRILEIRNLDETLATTGVFVFTVLLGLLLHGLVVLPMIYFVITGSHPFKLIGNVTQALVTAFGTSSSTAALPATVACLEDKHGVDPRIARFVLPLGAAINMDGTALYQAVAALFLVQLHGIPLDFASIVAVSFIATITSIGASGIPHAGLATMTMMMNVLGLPADSIAFLTYVDWILHRFRTTVNVLGDAIGASLVDVLCKDELDKFPIKPSDAECVEISRNDEDV